MISRLDLDQRVREWGLSEEVVEKDYVIGWVLWGIGCHETLARTWAFKGGTCLKKCYIETYRFSEDLDFTVVPGAPFREEELAGIFRDVLAATYEASGIIFTDQPPRFRTHPSGNYTEGRIYYRGPRGSPTPASLRLDLNSLERLARPTVDRPIAHAYPDSLPAPATVLCYSFEEVFAEKLRAMGERGRPRDLYDIVNLFRRDEAALEPRLVFEVLREKCASKGVVAPTLATIEASPFRAELETEWANMLGHQLPALPPFESIWAELPALFAWLEGELEKPILAPVSVREVVDSGWVLSPTVRTWGTSVPIEAIRFAAANRLCIDLGYGGQTRLIEPYSFRRTSAGAILLCAVKVLTRETRTYRLDRIEAVRVTDRTFTPTYLIELGTLAPHSAPRLTRTRRAPTPRARRTRR